MLLVTLQCPFGVQGINLTTRPEGPSCIRKRMFDFQFTYGNSPFWNLENVLSPRRDSAKTEPELGPFESLYILLCLRKGVWHFNLLAEIRLFEILKMFCIRMRWDGSDGLSNVSFNFLHTLWVYRTCIFIYIYLYILYPRIFSPAFLFVSKFDVKLGSWDFVFKTLVGKCVFLKSC